MFAGPGVADADPACGGGGGRHRAGGEPIGFVSSAPAAGLPPPPGFSPFSWPVDDGGVDVDMSCFPFNVDSSPSLSPIDLVCSDVSSPGQVHADCFPGGAPHERRPSQRLVSFADDVTMLGDTSSSVCSPDPGSPTQILPAVEEEDVIAPVGEPIRYVSSAPAAGLPPPPGFSPFSWPVDDGGVCVDLVCSDVSDSVDLPEVGLLVSPLVDSSSDLQADVGHPVLPLPSVENLFVQDMLWAPVAPQTPVPDDCRETPVPRWRLAREGPFLAERSPEYIRSLGAGCAFRNTTYRDSDYAAPSGDYGLPMHHPRFIEWIGVPQSASLLEISGGQWLDKLSRDQAITAAVHLQRDVGLMQTNLDVLDQYTLSLQGTASKMIELCLGSCEFPADEVAAGALGPWVRHASAQMEAMGLWRPSLDQLRLH